MVTRSTHHAHTSFVDGSNTVREMVEAALARGFVSIGLSEHARQIFEPQYGMSLEDEARYVAQTLAMRREFAGRIAVRLGVELDQYAQLGDFPYEYVIGSKHYLKTCEEPFSVDSTPETVRAMCARHFGGDWVRMAARYFGELADFICERRPDIIGHFDLVTKFNEGGKCFDESDPGYLAAGFDALKRMAPTGALLEINTGAIGRGYRTAPYPAPRFLRRWRELGGRVILGSDCHNANWLDIGYDASERLMRSCGYDSALRLGVSGFEEYPLGGN